MLDKIILLLLFSFSVFVLQAANPINSEDGVSVISMETADIQAIETLVEAEGLTYDQLKEKYPELMENAGIDNYNSDSTIFSSEEGSPLGIGGFWWGLVFGWIGILIVYMTMEDEPGRKGQVKKALFGCLANGVINTFIYLLYIRFLINNFN